MQRSMKAFPKKAPAPIPNNSNTKVAEKVRTFPLGENGADETPAGLSRRYPGGGHLFLYFYDFTYF